MLAAELALAANGEELPEQAVTAGLRGVKLGGRFEVLRRRPLLIVDGLHTPLARDDSTRLWRRRECPASVCSSWGCWPAKRLRAWRRSWCACPIPIVVVPPRSPRAADPAEVARAFTEAGAVVQRAPDVDAGLERARELAGDGGAVFVVGSLYTVSEARETVLGVTGDRALGLR